MYAYVGSGSEPGSIQPKEGVCVSQHRMQDAENAGEGGEAVNKKGRAYRGKGVVCNGRNGTCIIIQRGHQLVSYVSTKPPMMMTANPQMKLPLWYYWMIEMCSGMYDGERWCSLTWKQTEDSSSYVADNRIECQHSSLAPLVTTPIWTPIHIPYKTGLTSSV